MDEYRLFVSLFNYYSHSEILQPIEPSFGELKIPNNGYENSAIFAQDSTESSIVDSLFADSLSRQILDSLMSDSVSVLDTTEVDSMAIDSTARLKYFRHQREDTYYTPFRQKKKSSFFVQPSKTILKRTVELDSTGQFVIIKEEIAGKLAKPVLEIPLEEYIRLRMKWGNRELWEQKGYAYELKSGKYELEELISDITNIAIPLPTTSFLSIFGPPEINIQIRGSVDIHGAWRNETTEGLTASRLGNTKNEPDFSQTVQVNVNGTIGDKLTIKADWNTERDFEYENQLSLVYTGYEDEIIQSIEAGNVSLQTSPLVGGSEALFGIKARIKMGPLSLTALASQKKSEVEEVSVTGGSEKNEFEIRAHEYSENHYFLDQVYADTSADKNFFSRYYGSFVYSPNDSARFYKVKDIEVWKTYYGLSQPGKERRGRAFIDLPRRSYNQDPIEYYDDLRNQEFVTPDPAEEVIDERFIRLTEGSDFELHAETGYITFNSQIQKDEAVAVAYRIEGPDPGSASDDLFYGNFITDAQNDTSVVMVLKLIKPRNLAPQFRKAWKLQLKNIYPIGGRDIKEEGFVFDIKYAIDGADPVPEVNGVKLLEAFGFDKTDNTGTAAEGDGTFDYFPSKTIMPSTGEIIFPVLQPFGRQFPPVLGEDKVYQLIYDTTKTFAKQDREKDKFLMVGEYSASVSSTFNIGFNAVENSVRVTLGGSELKEGSDYRVDYNIGQITILNDAALVPGADLRITYEKNDLFQLASKTLLGLRGLYEFDQKTTLGFSYLNLNQQTLSEKVRIGEEPLNNSIMGVDFQTTQELPFLTKLMDNLYSTSAPSSFSLKGEFAYMSPDPNTKKSTIAGDQSQSIAYVDDFEGAKRIIPMGIGYGTWSDISIPNNLPVIGGDPDSLIMNYKAKTFWYNALPSDVTVQQIYGDRKSAGRDENQVTVLDFVFRPDERGTYNYNPAPDFAENKVNHWGGMMKPLSSSANNLIEENIEFIEFWLHLDGQAPNPLDSKIYIDIGQISEDVIPNRVLDTEDKNLNDLIDEGEDTGLDGMLDAEERAFSGASFSDPSNDNFQLGTGYDVESYVNINGTEGNAVLTDLGRVPDSEDLNRNYTLDRVNSYFRYQIPIDTTRGQNELIQGGGDNGWYLFRVPLKDFHETFGSPSFSLIEFIRVWIAGVEEEVHLRIAEFNFVGNQWQKVPRGEIDPREDETLLISTVSIEDNPEYYSPPGVQQERDLTQPDEEVYKNEQSLKLTINDLGKGDKREIVNYLYRPLDLFNYREMKMFIHGDLDSSFGNVSYFNNLQDYGADIYFRFGTDTLNFYEYRMPLKADWHNLEFVFSELTAIKELRDVDSISTDSLFQLPVTDKPGHSYGVLGKPTLTKVTYLQFGIENPVLPENGGSPTISGEIWLNELRVLGADDTPGWAYTASTSINFADLLSVSANVSQTDPYFHKLTERFGSRQDKTSWGISTTLDIEKLVPFNISGSNIKLNYSRTESISKPLYLPGTDVLVEEAANQRKIDLEGKGATTEEADKVTNQLISDTYTLQTSDTWALTNMSIKIPTNDWYIRDFINALSFSFTYNKTFSRNPTTLNSESWIWNASAKYNVSFGRDYYIEPVDIPVLGFLFGLFDNYSKAKWYFTPQSFGATVTAKRNRSFTQTRTIGVSPNINRDFITTRSAQFGWKLSENSLLNLSLNYKADVNASLAFLLTEGENERSEGEIWNDIFGGVGFGQANRFTQTVDIQSKPALPAVFDIDKYITLTGGYASTFTWQRDFRQEELGRSGQFSSRFQASLNVRLKPIMDPLFAGISTADSKVPTPPQPTTGRTRNTRGRGAERGDDSGEVDLDDEAQKNNEENLQNAEAQSDTLDIPIVEDTGPSIFTKGINFLALTVKYILFDYDQIRFNFSQTTSKAGSGLAADGTGFGNFWGFKHNDNEGPSRLFMLGLSQEIGPRAPNGQLTDNFSHKNNFDFKTSRPLWEGANLDIDWKVGWGVNKTTSLETDELGNVSINNITATGTLDRSFVSLPQVFFLPFVESGIAKVAQLYDRDAENKNESLSKAFIEGMESIPLISKIPGLADVMQYIPRPNWSVSWSGLEKFSVFEGIAKKVSLNHAYQSSYYESWKINPDGIQETQSQKISYGFNPLIGVNLTFDTILGGDLSGSVKYSTKSTYDLGSSTRNITETFTKDISITASYRKAGFELPLFGVNLKNDLEFSFSFSTGQNSVIVYEMENFVEEGKPQDGTTRISMEPRIKYVMSSKVTLSLFYKRTSVEPEGASRIPATTTNEAGLDVRISIQ